jgi:hypothetical protein
MKLFAQKGFNCAVVGGLWPEKWAEGLPVPGNVDPNEWDAFHDLVVSLCVTLCAMCKELKTIGTSARW